MSDTKFKVGDFVTCVDNEGIHRQLTVGRTYRVASIEDGFYRVTNDGGGTGSYFAFHFKLKEADPMFKVGDTVTCIDNGGYTRQLTVGKDYTALAGTNKDWVHVSRDDLGGIACYYPDQFKLKETETMSKFVETKTETKVTTTKTVKTVVDHKLDNGALISISNLGQGSLVGITIGAYKKDAERSHFRLESLRELIGILTEVAYAMESNEKS